jgi:glycosyltransferase involved in cell wall biosynthesis
MKFKDIDSLNVAIVTDWMAAPGGADRLVRSITEIFSNVDIFTAYYNPDRYPKGWLNDNVKIHTTFIQKLPWVRRIHRHYNFLTPLAFENLSLGGYELVISVSAGQAKGVILGIEQFHLPIILTPPRTLWGESPNIRGTRWKSSYKILGKLLSHYLRLWDYSVGKKLDNIATISNYISKRVEKVYGKESTVIYPGLSEFWLDSKSIEDSDVNVENPYDNYMLVVSRLYQYKQIDWAVKAAIKNRKNLVVVGEGPDLKFLKDIAEESPNIHFTGWISDTDLKYLYQNAEALIFPGLEDFGYVPLEAMSQGTPVIGYNDGGVAETVIEGRTGILFNTLDELYNIVESFSKSDFDKQVIKARAEEFSVEKFQNNIKKYIKSAYSEER